MLSFNFDANAGETPASIAQKRALVAQLLGQTQAPRTLGEGFHALGSGITANVMAGRAREAEQKGQSSADATFNTLLASLTGQAPAATPQAAPGTGFGSGAAPTPAGSPFMESLISSESGGSWSAQNDAVGAGGKVGHFGRLQFGQARLEDAKRAGVLPAHITPQQFMANPALQQQVEAWHFADIDKNLSQYVGTTVAGVPMTSEALRAMAHLGGTEGARRFVETGGRYNPSDDNGTSLMDYAQRHGGASAEPTLVASLDPSIGAQQTAQAAPAQLPPMAAPSAPSPAPTQVAQGPSLAQLMQAASNPWLNDGQRATINAMIEQQMQQQDPAYQLQMQAAQQGLEKGAMELDALRNPAPTPLPYEVIGGQVVQIDPLNGTTRSIGTFGTPEETAAMQNYQYLVGRGVDENEALERAFSSGVTVNTGDQGPRVGTIPPSMALVEDPSNPTGYRMETIPGSPEAMAQEAAATASAAGDQQQETYSDVVKEDIGRALTLLEQDPNFTTGMFGQVLGNWSGSNADRLDQLLNTVRSNVAFDRLQAMREASPTGGALGSVTERELKLLEATIGSLERSNPEDLGYNLKRVQEIYDRVMQKASAYPNAGQFGFGASQPAGQSVPADNIDALLEKYQ
jgi:hypothetical protein